jgi:hypothetical protein
MARRNQPQNMGMRNFWELMTVATTGVAFAALISYRALASYLIVHRGRVTRGVVVETETDAEEHKVTYESIVQEGSIGAATWKGRQSTLHRFNTQAHGRPLPSVAPFRAGRLPSR